MSLALCCHVCSRGAPGARPLILPACNGEPRALGHPVATADTRHAIAPLFRDAALRLVQQKYLDGSLGFAAGVMLAASYWSLLAPAIDAAAESGTYGAVRNGRFVAERVPSERVLKASMLSVAPEPSSARFRSRSLQYRISHSRCTVFWISAVRARHAV